MPVKVGVAWRRDGSEGAHIGDLQAMGSLPNVEVYSLIWSGAKHNNALREATIDEIDVLVIPGGPSANWTQVSLTDQTPKNWPSPNSKEYANDRAYSELDLIEQARYFGMPILALCGGSWRLVQNYGGQTIELGSLNNQGKIPVKPRYNKELNNRHAGNMELVKTEFKHPASVVQGTMLNGAINKPIPKNSSNGSASQRVPKANTQLQVNSVHWAVAYEGTMGNVQNSPVYQGIDPGGHLQVNARDSGPGGTVEGFEAKHGAPVLGVQWHPEYQLPLTGNGANHESLEQRKSRQMNLALIEYIVSAGSAYRARRNMLSEIEKDFQKHDSSKIQYPNQKGGQYRAEAEKKTPVLSTPLAPDEKSAPGNVSTKEKLVRLYLHNLKRTPWTLQPAEWMNLIDGRPLSGFREKPSPEPGDYKSLAALLAADVGIQRFIVTKDIQEARKYLKF
jgi:gamma-glutamyl-gamma-aminobutyrate hydrolase PuuD